MGDGLFKPGVVDNQSAVVQWLSDDSGLGIDPGEALANPVEFEEILAIQTSKTCMGIKIRQGGAELSALKVEHQIPPGGLTPKKVTVITGPVL